MATRKWYIDQALTSFTSLNGVIEELSHEEVMACLDLEAASRRRPTVIKRLISRAVRLAEIETKRQLTEKYHGKKDPDPR